MLALLALLVFPADAATPKVGVYRAEPKKTQVYIREGVVEGGEPTIQGAFVSNIRRSKNADFERVVVDIDSKAVPAFHISVEPGAHRILVTVMGNAKTSFDATKIVSSFRKSALIERVDLFPKLDDGFWTFSLQLRREVPVEAFTLSGPSRIVLDLKTITIPTKAIQREDHADKAADSDEN